jgi:hypothetical protein
MTAAMAGLAISAPAARAQTLGGLSTIRAQSVANQAIASFPAEENDHFAWSLATGDFNGDGRDELATGVPEDDGPTTAPVTDGGALIVRQYVPGAGLGLAKFVRQSAGLDAPEAGDGFGRALASCDFNRDGFDDLAVGIPHEGVGSISAAGAVQVHYGRNASFPGFGSEFFTQNTAGIAGDADDFDLFGFALACGDFNDDSFDDLAIGIPADDVGGGAAAGRVVILPGF